MVRTLKDDEPLRLLLNLLFYHFNRSELTYKSQRIMLLDVIEERSEIIREGGLQIIGGGS